MVRNVRLHGKYKLADKWEANAYVVVKHAGDLPVYTVRPEEGPTHALHRDLLVPCSFLPMAREEEPLQPKPVRRPQTHQTAGAVRVPLGSLLSMTIQALFQILTSCSNLLQSLNQWNNLTYLKT